MEQETHQTDIKYFGGAPNHPARGQTCIICQHPDAHKIAEAIKLGTPFTHVARKYGTDDNIFTGKNVTLHVERCLKTTWAKIREDRRIKLVTDVDKAVGFLIAEAEEAYFAAKDVLMLDGDLCFDPRAHEINVVYQDWTDLNKQTGEPKLKSASLSALLAKVAEAGFEPKHSYIKAEDARKGFRDCLNTLESLTDKVIKLQGGYQKDRDNVFDELKELRELIKGASIKLKSTYEEELGHYLADYGHRLRPDLRQALEREYGGMGVKGTGNSGALGRPQVGVKALPESTEAPRETIEVNTDAIDGQIVD
jgi:hypothetical protein